MLPKFQLAKYSNRTGWFALLSGLALFGHAVAQDSLDVDALDEKLQRHLQAKMPGWQHKRIEPIQGSKGVLIQTWTTSNRGVRIVVTRCKTAAEAKARIENFMKEVKGLYPVLVMMHLSGVLRSRILRLEGVVTFWT